MKIYNTDEERAEAKRNTFKRYYERNKKKMQQRALTYYEANKEQIIEKKRPYLRKYYQLNKERLASEHAEYMKTDAGKKSKQTSNKSRRLRLPIKCAANSAVSHAIRDGRLKRLPCTVCGAHEHVQAHHEDYQKQLAVVWLCRKHHQELHNA